MYFSSMRTIGSPSLAKAKSGWEETGSAGWVVGGAPKVIRRMAENSRMNDSISPDHHKQRYEDILDCSAVSSELLWECM